MTVGFTSGPLHGASPRSPREIPGRGLPSRETLLHVSQEGPRLTPLSTTEGVHRRPPPVQHGAAWSHDDEAVIAPLTALSDEESRLIHVTQIVSTTPIADVTR